MKREQEKKDKKKVLIIKAGYSEVLDLEDNSRKPSFGDILRTTVILNLYKNANVTWVSDIAAFPLLEGNPYITALLPYDFTTVSQLESQRFDMVVNLEKIPGICALADRIHAWKKYGFRFDETSGRAEAYDRAAEVLDLGSSVQTKKGNNKHLQELLFEMVEKKWNGEEYVLGYCPKISEKYDVCLNTTVGLKWPIKAWSSEKWNMLEARLKESGLKVDRQDSEENKQKGVLTNLHSYMDWINSGKVLVTNDSLGMHLGIAMKKQLVVLFGPSHHREVHFYGRGEPIFPEGKSFRCMPCCDTECRMGTPCMEYISPKRVYSAVEKALAKVS